MLREPAILACVIEILPPFTLVQRSLLETHVSDLMARNEAVVPLLVRHGVTPLGHPLLRGIVAKTLTLEQALRLQPLPLGRKKLLLDRIGELCAIEEAERSEIGSRKAA